MGTPNQSPHPWDTLPMGNPLFLDPSHHPPFHLSDDADGGPHELGAMKEMIYKIAAMQPVDIDPASIKKPRRRNVRISDDPQSVAARHRRERISERIRILQRLVPGGTKMDTASMLDEAIRYVKFLKKQVLQLQMTSQPLQAGQLSDSAADWPDRGSLEFPPAAAAAAGRRGSSMG